MVHAPLLARDRHIASAVHQYPDSRSSIMPWVYAAAQVCENALCRLSSWFETKSDAEAAIEDMAWDLHIAAMCDCVFVIRQWLRRSEGNIWVGTRVVKPTVNQSNSSFRIQYMKR